MKRKYLLLTLVFFGLFSLAYGLQSDNIIIYQSVPDPSLGISSFRISLNETVYFVIYNNGTESVYISNLTHDWGRKYVGGIEASYIGNDKIGYEDILQNTSIRDHHQHRQKYRYIDVVLSNPIEIEPGSYIEWYYTMIKRQGIHSGSSETKIMVYFNDSSLITRNKTIRILPSPVIQTDFKIDNLNYSTAEGADYNISANTTYNFLFRVTNFANLINTKYRGYAGVTFYNGNITILFPTTFSGISPISNNTYCIANICNCSVNFTLYTPPIVCEIRATTPISGGDYIIYANASENTLFPPWIFPMNSVSELFVKIHHCPEPNIYYASVSPREIYFGEFVEIVANVSSRPPITNVWLQVDGKNIFLELDSGDYLNGSYKVKYFPTREGNFSLTLFAKNKCRKISNYSLGNITVKPPITPPPPEACKNISTIGLVEMPGVISVDKLNALLDLNYYCTKNILGLWDYDLYLEVTYLNGTLISIDGTSMFYGIAPGRTSKDIIYGIHGTGMMSPRYKWVGGQYSLAINFERYVVLQINQKYELVKVTLGVWA